MKSRVVRVVLFLLVILAFVGAAYNIATIEQHQATVRRAARGFDQDMRQADQSLTELKAARFAYVAPGQGIGFWAERATTLGNALSATLKKLQQDAATSNARASIADAAQTLDASKQLDSTVQGYARSDQPMLASDLIFGDLRQAQEAVRARLASAQEEEQAATDATLEAGRRMELATAGGAALFALIVLLILLPAGRRTDPQLDASAHDAGTARGRNSIAPAPVVAPKPPSPARPASDVLPQAATLCTDFARLKETSELPALLERLARLLDAAGIIVWIAEPAKEELRPAAAHGYAANALTHIRAISADADNATASAYRRCSMQVVKADDSGNGAIAVPLVTPDGCVGVMAAELRDGGERQSQTQAIATIVAAQIAMLVAPQDTPEANGR